MRYENWDVLLFPEGCRVPIQEFKTQCFVTKDMDSPYLQVSAATSPPAYYPIHGNIGQIPVLTTFVPSMPKDSPFRVSIHSWEKPRPSRFMEKLMQADDVLVFEARVLIDGQPVAGGIFGQRSLWPYVIDFSSNIDRDGNQDVLRFPDFHPEILDQQHWDAGDPFGRVQVIISEGFSRPMRSPPFERVKNVISLSFQHAPLHILEFSNLAWPNANMWNQALYAGFKFDSIGKPDTDNPHGHSPSRPEPRPLPVATSGGSSGSQGGAYNAWVSNRAFPIPASQWNRQSQDRRWGVGVYLDRNLEPFTNEQGLDSLVSDEVWHHRGARSSREDVPMPDYSSIASSRVMSSVTGMSYEHSKQPSMTTPMDDDQYNELIQALTPTKLPNTGTRAPSNTPSTQVGLVDSGVTGDVRPHGSTRASALREVSQPSTRDVSGSSNRSPPTEQIITPSKLGLSPCGNIKGKKERVGGNSKVSPRKSSGVLVVVPVEEPKENNIPQEKDVASKEMLSEQEMTIASL
ncbi:hypothetical protein N7490_008515 [Penicillium lividum]|nr:hypothetical protein N7490_008515 [Penicillium lividum]